MARKSPTVRWRDAPAEHDYPSAGSYLGLIAAPALVDVLLTKLAQAPTVQHHAKDILRAARLPLLPPEDPEVARDLRKVAKAVPLSPILLVRGDIGTARGLQIADGYHRVCASYHLNDATEVPCRLADLPALGT